MSKKNLLSLAVIVIAALVVAACAPAATPEPTPEQTIEPTEEPEPQTIVDISVADGRFTTLVIALQEADLAETLAGEGPFTVFAPTDDAFNKLPEGTVEALLADIPALTDILLYHIMSGGVLAEDVLMLEEAETLLGKNVEIEIEDDNAVMINDTLVIIPISWQTTASSM